MQINRMKNQKEIKDHGDYAFPVNVSIEHIESYEQGAFLWHWHPEIELTCILSGEIEYHVNQKTYILKEGEGVFGNSSTLHAGYRIGEQKCTYLSVTFHPRFLYGYENSILQTKYVGFITENEEWDSLKFERETPWHQEVLAKMKNIYEMFQEPPRDYEMQTHLELTQIWQKLYAYFCERPAKASKPSRNLQRLRDMITYIQEHYREEISLEDIAAHVNICKSECCRFFRKHMNMTILEYIMFYRIGESLPLLKAGESVTKTAGMVGFSSAAYYGQIFKRYMKCTPKEYQKQKI